MNELFADAFYYIALFNQADRYHQRVVEATKRIDRPIVTTIWVLMELADALSARPYRGRGYHFIKTALAEPNVTVVKDLEPWLTRGLALYGGRPDKSWSLTDCISFEVMTDRVIAEALTGDRHFTQAGFHALLVTA